MDAVLARRKKTQRIAHIAVTAFKAFVCIAALLMGVGSYVFSQASDGALLILFLLVMSFAFAAAGSLLSLVSLIQNTVSTRMFPLWWNIATVAAILLAIACLIVIRLAPGGETAVLFFVWLVLLCVPSGFEFAVFWKYLQKKKKVQ